MNTETTRTIVVLDDGETFGGADGATLNVISHEQHEELCDGGDFADLSGTPASTYNIAALPDLLQVCRDCAEHWHDTDAPIGSRLREAIAKATGGDA